MNLRWNTPPGKILWNVCCVEVTKTFRQRKVLRHVEQSEKRQSTRINGHQEIIRCHGLARMDRKLKSKYRIEGFDSSLVFLWGISVKCAWAMAWNQTYSSSTSFSRSQLTSNVPEDRDILCTSSNVLSNRIQQCCDYFKETSALKSVRRDKLCICNRHRQVKHFSWPSIFWTPMSIWWA